MDTRNFFKCTECTLQFSTIGGAFRHQEQFQHKLKADDPGFQKTLDDHLKKVVKESKTEDKKNAEQL